MTSIGFIGLGKMGCPMAGRLIAAGHQLALYRVKDRARHLVQSGGQASDSGRQAAAAADIVILMLPDTPDVAEVLFGSDGIVEALRPGALVIDMSSISPVATRDFAARVRCRPGCDYLDAPVSGGEIGAKEGTLTVMAGGSLEAFERAGPILQTLGKNITLIGECGAGQVAKVANQMIVALTIQAVSEAFLLAKRAGVDVARIREALLGGFANSRILDLHGQRIIDAAFDPGFRIRLHRKDLGLALDAAKALEIALPNTAVALQMMNAAVGRGDGDLDHSGFYRTIEHLSAVAD